MRSSTSNAGETPAESPAPACHFADFADPANLPVPKLQQITDPLEVPLSAVGRWYPDPPGSRVERVGTRLTAYEGAWSAMAKMTGAGEPSFMEALVSEEANESLTLSYHRKLLRPDTADDFEAAYYAAGQWVSLEHLGDGRASDGAFVEKSYDIPLSTQKIRFMCECGAVSEQCYLDNVRISAY